MHQTPIVNGQLKTVRYYSYFPQAIDIMKSMLTESTYYNAAGVPLRLNPLQLEALAKVTQLEDLYAITKEDFYVIKPCPSLLRSGVEMEGTRLTLVAHDPEGFEFTIRTPGTPARWALFDAEISACFQRVVEVLAAGGEDGGERDPLQYSQEILRLALELFYFWVTFAPLSRGTAGRPGGLSHFSYNTLPDVTIFPHCCFDIVRSLRLHGYHCSLVILWAHVHWGTVVA